LTQPFRNILPRIFLRKLEAGDGIGVGQSRPGPGAVKDFNKPAPYFAARTNRALQCENLKV
jgi:hypothetical protein